MAGSEIGSATFGLVVGMGRFKKQLDEAEGDAKASGKRTGKNFTDKATDEVKAGESRWAGALDAMKPALLGAGAALGVAAVVGFGQGLEIEASGDKLAAQLNLDPLAAESAARIAGDVYAGAWGESLDEVHDAVGAVWSSLGYMDPAGIEAATIKALDLAAAFDLDVTRAVQSAGILMTSGLAADADEAFDLITRGLQSMPANMREELLEASDEYSQFFAQLGIDGPEAFGMLAAAAQRGPYEIDKVGDAIKELTIRSTDMSTASVDAYKAMGLNAEATANKILAGGDQAAEGFDEIVAGLLGIEDPVTQANAAIALFGTPLEDLSVQEIPEFLAGLDSMQTSLGDVEGATDDMGDTLNDNARTEIEAFKREALMGLGNFAADHAIPALKELGAIVRDDVIPAVRGVTEWMQDNKTVVTVAAAVIGGVLVAAFTAWAVSAGIAAAATIAATWPILAIGAAAGALAYLVVTHWATIQGAFESVWSWVRDNWPMIVAFFTGPIGWVVYGIARHWDTIVATVTGLPSRIASAASGMWDGISNAFREMMNRVIGWWNNLRFPTLTIPSINLGFLGSYGGGSFGGWNLPNIPYLARGGTATTGGLSMVGERGPELLHLPTGASVVPLPAAGRLHEGGDGSPEIIQLTLDGRVVAEVVRNYDTDRDRRNGYRGAA